MGKGTDERLYHEFVIKVLAAHGFAKGKLNADHNGLANDLKASIKVHGVHQTLVKLAKKDVAKHTIQAWTEQKDKRKREEGDNDEPKDSWKKRKPDNNARGRGARGVRGRGAGGRGGRGRSNEGDKGPRCLNCRDFGHVAQECNSMTFCYTCRKKAGHRAEECPTKK